MTYADVAQKHAMDFQLLAIRCGAVYGALALGGLMAAHIVLMQSAVGVALACAAALFAYVNFTIAANNAQSVGVPVTQWLSIGAGLASGVLLVLPAL